MEQFVEIFKMYSIISAFKGIPDIREAKDKGFSRHTNDCFLFFSPATRPDLTPWYQRLYFFPLIGLLSRVRRTGGILREKVVE